MEGFCDFDNVLKSNVHFLYTELLNSHQAHFQLRPHWPVWIYKVNHWVSDSCKGVSWVVYVYISVWELVFETGSVKQTFPNRDQNRVSQIQDPMSRFLLIVTSPTRLCQLPKRRNYGRPEITYNCGGVSLRRLCLFSEDENTKPRNQNSPSGMPVRAESPTWQL